MVFVMTMRIALPYTCDSVNNPTDIYRKRLDGSTAAGAYFDKTDKKWVGYWRSMNVPGYEIPTCMPNEVQQTVQEAMEFIDTWLLNNDEYLL